MATSARSPDHPSERKLVLMMVDLAGSSRVMSGMNAVEIARLIDAFYVACGKTIDEHGGRIVKFIGDGCLAVFPERHGEQAVDAALVLQDEVARLCGDFDVEIELGTNIHQAVVAEVHFTVDGSYDIVGAGVIHVFRMGAGAGIRISEPVYRQLPNDRRGTWNKHRPPATYTLSAS